MGHAAGRKFTVHARRVRVPQICPPQAGHSSPKMAEPARSWARFSLMLPCLTSAAGPFQQDVMLCQGHAAEPTLAGLWHPLAWAEDRE